MLRRSQLRTLHGVFVGNGDVCRPDIDVPVAVATHDHEWAGCSIAVIKYNSVADPAASTGPKIELDFDTKRIGRLRLCQCLGGHDTAPCAGNIIGSVNSASFGTSELLVRGVEIVHCCAVLFHCTNCE